MLSKQAIEEYQKIVEEEQGTRLLRFFELLIEIDRKNKKRESKLRVK